MWYSGVLAYALPETGTTRRCKVKGGKAVAAKTRQVGDHRSLFRRPGPSWAIPIPGTPPHMGQLIHPETACFGGPKRS